MGAGLRLSADDGVRAPHPPPQMLGQPRDDLDEVARPVPGVELRREESRPRRRGRPRATREGRRDRCPPPPRAQARELDRRGPDLLVGEHREEHAEGRHRLLVDRLVRLDRHVAPGEPRFRRSRLTASTPGSAIPRPPSAASRSPPARRARSRARRAGARRPSSRSTSRSPERSSAGPRLSETVRTAILHRQEGAAKRRSPPSRDPAAP